MAFPYVRLKFDFLRERVVASIDAVERCTVNLKLMSKPRAARGIQTIGSRAPLECATVRMKILIDMAPVLVSCVTMTRQN